MIRLRAAILLLLLLAVSASLPCLGQGTPQVLYIYDELGRLVGVIDPNGDSAQYAYDAAGNLLSITRKTASQVSIIEFTPDQGPVGSNVTIYGSGFSTTPAQNTVKFNGTTAVVITSTANQITTTVPAGATTGTISVTSPSGSANSSTPFTVGPSSAPTLSGFTPGSGTPGTALTINGTNFSTVLANDRITINTTHAWATSATATSLVTAVPLMASSGRIAVATPLGQAVSASDFIIPPTGFTTADVGFSGRVVLGSPITASIPAANKIALALFDGIAGHRVSLMWSGNTIPGTTYINLINPDGSNLTTPIGNGAAIIEPQTMLTTGTYSILVDPSGTGTGNITLTPYEVPADFTSPITPGGPAVTATMTVPGQNGKLTFTGVAGQRVAVSMGSSTIPGITYVSILKPDGTNLVFPVGSTSGFIDTKTLPVDGTYTILVDPNGTGTGSITITLYDVPADFTAPITAGGAPVTAVISAVGQNARLTFSGTANQRVSVSMGSSTIPGITYVSVLNPDGSSLVFPVGSSSGFIDTFTLPTSGVYTILVDPNATGTGSLTVTLYDVGSDFTGTIVPGGSPVTVTITVPGQNARLTFTGAVGQRVSLAMTNSTIPGLTTVSILKPDGSYLVNPTVTSGGFIDPATIPVAGTYTVLTDPLGVGTGSLTLTLYDVPADFTGSITAGGSAVTTTTTVPGQNARLTFNGTTGQRVSVGMTNSTIPGLTTVSILNPDSTILVNPTVTSSGFIDTATLGVSGTYTILVDCLGAGTGSLTLTLYDVPADFTGSITPGGSPVTTTTTVPGQNARLTFNGTTGQRVSVAMTNSTMTGLTTVSILNPDGTTLVNPTVTSSGFIDTKTLVATGAHTIVVDGSGPVTGSLTLTLHDVPADFTSTITPNGSSVAVTLSVPGQNGQLTFSGSSGQQVTVHVTGNTMGLVTVKLLKPDQSVLTSWSSSSSSFNLPTQTLPTAGTYTITVDPNAANTGTMNVSVTVP